MRGLIVLAAMIVSTSVFGQECIRPEWGKCVSFPNGGSHTGMSIQKAKDTGGRHPRSRYLRDQRGGDRRLHVRAIYPRRRAVAERRLGRERRRFLLLQEVRQKQGARWHGLAGDKPHAAHRSAANGTAPGRTLHAVPRAFVHPAQTKKPRQMPGLSRQTNAAAALRLLRPRHALIAERHRADALVDELLHAFTLVGLGRVEVALGVRRDAVHAVELARLASAVAERGDFLEGCRARSRAPARSGRRPA